MNSTRFKERNTVFTNVLKDVNPTGKGISHYQEIEPVDLEKLHAGFDVHNPAGLQDLV